MCVYSRQSRSSEASKHSARPVHNEVRFMHSPVPHSNWWRILHPEHTVNWKFNFNPGEVDSSSIHDTRIKMKVYLDAGVLRLDRTREASCRMEMLLICNSVDLVLFEASFFNQITKSWRICCCDSTLIRWMNGIFIYHAPIMPTSYGMKKMT
jgi:hypothetical protein